MEKITLEEVQKWQKNAVALEKRNGNRVQLWYSPSTGKFTLLELVGMDYVVDAGDNVRIPFRLDYMGFETVKEREVDLLARTNGIVAEINALC